MNGCFDTTLIEGSEIEITDQLLEKFSVEEIQSMIGLPKNCILKKVEDLSEESKNKFIVTKHSNTN